MRDPLSTSTVIEENHGILVAHMIDAGPRGLPFNYLTAVPENYNSSQKVNAERLVSVDSWHGTGSLFISQIPAGEYTISSFRSWYTTGEYYYNRWASTDVSLGTFTVEPGKITDLGTLIYYTKSKDDSFEPIVTRAPYKNNQFLLEQYDTDIEYDANSALSWHEDNGIDDRYALYSSIVRNPITYNQRYLAPNGNVFFVGKLGYILQRTQEGDWLEDAIPADYDLNAIAQNKQGDIVVGGDYGTLFLKPANSEQWLDIAQNPQLSIEYLDFTANGNLVIISKNRKVAQFYQIPNLSTPNVTQDIASFETVQGWIQNGEAITKTHRLYGGTNTIKERQKAHWVSSVHTTKMDNDLLIFVGQRRSTHGYPQLYESEDRYVVKYNLLDQSLTSIEDLDKGIDHVIDAGAIKLGYKEGASFLGIKTKDKYFLYNSQTKTWLPITPYINRCPGLPESTRRCRVNGEEFKRKDDFVFLGIPVFKDADQATALVRFEQGKTEDDKPRVGVIHTSDGGASWQEVADSLPSKYCASSVPEAYDTLLVSCANISSDFYESKDGGLSWQHVRQNENF